MFTPRPNEESILWLWKDGDHIISANDQLWQVPASPTWLGLASRGIPNTHYLRRVLFSHTKTPNRVRLRFWLFVM